MLGFKRERVAPSLGEPCWLTSIDINHLRNNNIIIKFSTLSPPAHQLTREIDYF
jgi:hypothetical protein